jgi:hypothetical protein
VLAGLGQQLVEPRAPGFGAGDDVAVHMREFVAALGRRLPEITGVFWTLMALPNTLVSPRSQSIGWPAKVCCRPFDWRREAPLLALHSPRTKRLADEPLQSRSPALTSSRFWLDFHQPPVRVMELHRRSHVTNKEVCSIARSFRTMTTPTSCSHLFSSTENSRYSPT